MNRRTLKSASVGFVQLAVCVCVLFLSACGGGGGSLADNNDVQEDPVTQEPDTQEPDTQEPDTQEPDTQEPDTQEPDTQDPDVQEPDMQNPDLSELLDSQGTVLGSGAVATLGVIGGMPAVGIDGGIVLGVGDLRFEEAGALAFRSRIQTPLIDSSRAQEHILAGPITSPQVVLGPDTIVEGIRTGYRFSFSEDLDVAANSTVATLASISGEGIPGDFFSGGSTNALIRADASGATSLVAVDDMVMSLSGEVQLTTLDQVSISNAGVAFLGRIRGAGSPFGLFISDGERFKSIVEDVNGASEEAPVIGGCRVLLSRNSPQQLHMLDSGALVFNSTIEGGNIFSPCESSESAVLSYENDQLSVVAREGNPVPGSDTFVFGAVRLLDVLSNGSIVVTSTLADRTRGFAQRDIILRNSAWLIKRGEEPRLIYLEGETMERSDGSVVLDLENIDSEFNSNFEIGLNVNKSDQIALRLHEQRFSPSVNRLSVHSGTVRISQPHSSLETPGASQLLFTAEIFANAGFTGSSISAVTGSSGVASGFAETDRLLRIGDVNIDSQGNVYFHARVLDTVSMGQKGDYVFRRNSSGQLSVVVSPLDRVTVNGRDELILSSVISSGFGLTTQSVNVELIVMEDDSLVIHDTAKGSAVQIRFR